MWRRVLRRHSRALTCVVVLVTAALALGPLGSASAAGCKGQYLKPNKSNLKPVERAIRCLLNRERSKRAMKALRSHWALLKAATRHSRSMVRNRYFAHIGRDGSTPKARMKRAGYRGKAFAENITYGTGGYATPRSVVQRWMSDGGHRANVLGGAYDDVGIGLWLGNPEGRGGATFTMTVGGR
ncbi:MAG: CAP domain-containing protein [Solirubrobacteraceae bacterium]